MVWYGRRSYGRNKTVKFPRRTKTGRTETNRQLTKEVKILKQKVSKINTAIEKRYADNQRVKADVTQTSSPFLMNGLSKDDERDGYQVAIDKIYATGFIHSPGHAIDEVAEAAAVRILIVYDSQPNGSAITAGVIFQQDAYPWYSTYDHNNKSRFRILYDQRFGVDADTVQPFEVNLNYKRPLKTQYNGDDDLITSIETGSIYMFVFSDSNATPHPQLEISSYVRYMDA